MFQNLFESEKNMAMRERVRKFALERIAPQARELDEAEVFSVSLAKEMADAGFFGIYLPREYGGQGLDFFSFIITVEELARIDSSQAAVVAVNNSLGIGAIYSFGTEEQKKEILPDLCQGPGLWAFGLTEADAGSDAQAIKTNAVYDSAHQEWIINGSKRWTTNSCTKISKGITLLAVTDNTPNGRPELSCFLVPVGTAGLKITPMKGKTMWRAVEVGELSIENMRLPASSLLGERGKGFKMMMQLLDRGRLAVGAMALGLAQGAFDLALDYSKKRKTFGKYLCSHQALSCKLAEMATRIEAGRTILYKAAYLCQSEQPYGKEAAMAKLFCSEVAEFCAREGQQIFGGFGLIKDNPIERFYRDATVLRIGEGTSEILKMVISRHLGC